jgi:hypothetical protein
VHVVGWTNPEAVRVMREEYGRLPAAGVAVVTADFGEELPADAVYADGTREVTNRYQARAGRHQVEVEGHHGEVLLDAPPGVELRR